MLIRKYKCQAQYKLITVTSHNAHPEALPTPAFSSDSWKHDQISCSDVRYMVLLSNFLPAFAPLCPYINEAFPNGMVALSEDCFIQEECLDSSSLLVEVVYTVPHADTIDAITLTAHTKPPQRHCISVLSSTTEGMLIFSFWSPQMNKEYIQMTKPSPGGGWNHHGCPHMWTV